MKLLDKIHSPKDLRKLPAEKLTQLACEIRQRIIEVVSVTGGHLASSLGTVELAIALHYSFHTPQDAIVWDVGHQAYAHKILTGRNKDFVCLRQWGGLSGFPCKDESAFDSFTTGHSSTAVSLALGMVCARDLAQPHQNYKVIAVIGDGSLSGGLCFEGLNNAGHLKKDLLVILNTNELSIAPNVGALSTYLNKIISLPLYNRFRSSLEDFVRSRLPKDSRILKLATKFEEGLKGLFVPGLFFEELGFRYFGPLDGHNLPLLISTLKNISAIKGPLLLHVVTKKGKGYLPAENNPVRFHSASPFTIKTGEAVSSRQAEPTFTQAFSKSLVALAKTNNAIAAITAAMPEGTGLDTFRDAYPERFFDVGIAEEHAVCFAAGLAKMGMRPVVAVYSTFLQRAYDQLIEAVSLQNLPVVFALDRAGVVGEDGATHQGIFDISYLRDIPGMVIMAPKDALELTAMLEFSLGADRACAIRYPKAVSPSYAQKLQPIELGVPEIIRQGSDFIIIAFGSIFESCWLAVEALHSEGITGTLVNARFAKPLDPDSYRSLIHPSQVVFTAEEGIIDGGFGSALGETIGRPVERIGLQCDFIPCGKRQLLLAKYGLDKEGIYSRIKETLNKKA